jgi:hypothetical protein
MKHLTIAALAAALLCNPALAADKPGRLVLDVKIDGSGHQAKDRSQSRFNTVESMHAAFTLLGGDPEDSNRLDHDGNAATMQKQVNEANARAPSRDQQQAMMEKARAQAAACKNDIACMQKIAMDMAKTTSSWSVRPAPVGASAGRYITYAAADAAICKPEYTAKIRNDVEGTFPDVQGLVPFTNTTSADFKASNMQSLPLCSAMLVLDQSTGKIYLSMQHADVLGNVKRTEGGRVRVNDSNIGVRMNQDALEWVAKTLNGAAKSGKERTTLKIPTDSKLGGVGEKTINVEMSWKFES